jgi:hypothetical protein
MGLKGRKSGVAQHLTGARPVAEISCRHFTLSPLVRIDPAERWNGVSAIRQTARLDLPAR